MVTGCLRSVALVDAEKLVDCLVAAGAAATGAVGDAEWDESTAAAAPAAVDLPPGVIPSALAAYTASRWGRVQFYGAQSRLLTPLFASRSGALASLRDGAMAKLCNALLITNFVHGVLCGAQVGDPPPSSVR